MLEKILTIAPVVLVATTTVLGWILTYKKSSKKDKAIKLAEILQKLPTFIKAVEQSCTNPNSGAIKKLLVLNQCQLECNNANIEYKEQEWSAEIEKILETPQKKGEKDEKKIDEES